MRRVRKSLCRKCERVLVAKESRTYGLCGPCARENGYNRGTGVKLSLPTK